MKKSKYGKKSNLHLQNSNKWHDRMHFVVPFEPIQFSSNLLQDSVITNLLSITNVSQHIKLLDTYSDHICSE